MWWLALVAGFIGIGTGAVTLVWPGLSAVTLLCLVVTWAIVMDLSEIMRAVCAQLAVCYCCINASEPRSESEPTYRPQV